MRLWPFTLERWQSVWENQVELNLSESGVHPLRLDEVLDAAGLSDLAAAPLGYPQTNGTPGLRATIAALYPGATAANILVTNGGSEANFVATWALLAPGDEAVVMAPNYMQLDGLVRTLGATVRPLALVEERGWALDHAALDELVGPRTKLIAVCNPNNPTGMVLSDTDRAALVAAADRVGAWLLADEIYRGAERDTDVETATFWGSYDHLLVTAGLSKAYGLPGLRIGWVVAPAEWADRLWAYHDYTSIAPSALSDYIATVALDPTRRPDILARTRGIIRANYPIVAHWATEAALFTWTPPAAGAIVTLRYGGPGLDGLPSEALAERLRREQSVLVVPGVHFGVEGTLRLGFGSDPDFLQTGLSRISAALAHREHA